MEKLSETLRDRGYVYQFSAPTLEEITDGPQRTVYLGVDPTADSIHVGNLATYMLLRRFADAGHKVILLIGGGTGMIGDPKPDVERPLLSAKEIEERSQKLKAQAQKLLGGIKVTLVNNADWLSQLHLIDFLRDTGKHFTVNALVKKDAISARMQSEEGISYTEFSYPLLQAYDFWHLHTEYGCDVQIGGSDQWGNIVAGTDLVRRTEGHLVYALTLPIITDKATGKKFGKSEGNAVWLDANKTSPFTFYQFWLNVSDESVEEYLKLFTLLSADAIADILKQHQANPATRKAQKLLALEVTALVHGVGAAADAAQGADTLFVKAFDDITADDVLVTMRVNPPSVLVSVGNTIADSLVSSGLATSKREARQFLTDGAVTLNDQKTSERALEKVDFKSGIALLRRGKRNVAVLRLE